MFAMNVSIDGCYEHTLFAPNEEVMQYFTSIVRGVDLVVTGRKMHQLMVPYWPEVAKNQSGTKTANEYARAVTDIKRVVFSRTLQTADENTRIVQGDLEGEIRRLKQLPGKTISVGGVSVRAQLLALGLIDEIYLMVHPIIVGQGKRFLDDTTMPQMLNLKLVETKTFKSGCVMLHYVKE